MILMFCRRSHKLKVILVYLKREVGNTENDIGCSFPMCGDKFNLAVLLAESVKERAICDMTRMDRGYEH